MSAVILAGGFGTRLQPISTADRPKQFHDLLGNGCSLLQETVMRAQEFASNHRIITIGNIQHWQILKQQLRVIDPKLAKKAIFEPRLKNTAASIFLAAKAIKKGVMVILPSDHYINGDFTAAVKEAIAVARAGKIVTFGITPDYPNTNYGYIVNDKFVEKPDVEKAAYLISQGALWNSGIFVADAEVVLAEFKKHAPQFFDVSFSDMPPLPFDKAIMEKTDLIHTLPANFEWDDLGNFTALRKYSTLPELADIQAA